MGRRQRFVFAFCCGVAGAVAGGYSGAARGAPLRVDPALLGVPAARAVPGVRSSTEPAGRETERSHAREDTEAFPRPVSAGEGEDISSAPSVKRPDAPPAEDPPVPAPAITPAAWEEENASPDRSSALALRAAPKMASPSRGDPALPAFMSALRMTGEVDREFVAEGEAELRKMGSIVNSDSMTYWPLEDEVEAEGRVRLQQSGDVMTGPKMRLRLADRVGYFEQPFYRLKRQLLGEKPDAAREASDQEIERLVRDSGGSAAGNAGFAARQFQPDDGVRLSQTPESHGEAERLYFEGENQYRLVNNTFTTCSVDNDAWYVRTSELKIDRDHDLAEGRDAIVYFKDVPFLYSPWFSFSLGNERSSGFLTPSLGTNSDSGVDVALPYYWNIAPNMDATIVPRLMSRRGIQLGNEFRYLNTAFGGLYRGVARAEYMPNDRLRDGTRRYAYSFTHEQTSRSGLSGTINYNKVSDDHYYTDLSSEISRSSQTQLLQQGVLSYGRGAWSASVNFQQYQTLQPDKKNPVLEQYRMLPQITFNARQPDFRGLDLSLLGQYTNFTIRRQKLFVDERPNGRRAVLHPQISMPYVTPGWYVTPRFGVNYRAYSLSGQKAGMPGSMSVSLPIFSLDSGMTFERPSRWFGKDYVQTLEPRLYYVNIPYRDQSKIPLFDTALADFNFAQIFSENQFSGQDRINNANQLTAALTSRLLESESGAEIMRGMIGQRFYFTRNKVALDGPAVSRESKWSRSDFLAAFSGQVLPKVFVDTALQYDFNERIAKRYSAGVRYQPEPGKVLNLAYRRNREADSPVNQIDVSGQWPLYGRWHGVGRLNYSFRDDGTVLSTGRQGGRIIESIAGLEYNGGCWILRGVVRRQALTSVDASTSFYVQLELSGLGRIGTSPLNLLRRDIQGYRSIADSGSESVFGD